MDYKEAKEILNRKTAIQITVDGQITEITPKNGTDFSLEEFYEYTNCDCIENVYLPNDKIMVVDEEGALRENRKVNETASKFLYIISVSEGKGCTVPIFGNVMVINREQER